MNDGHHDTCVIGEVVPGSPPRRRTGERGSVRSGHGIERLISVAGVHRVAQAVEDAWEEGARVRTAGLPEGLHC